MEFRRVLFRSRRAGKRGRISSSEHSHNQRPAGDTKQPPSQAARRAAKGILPPALIGFLSAKQFELRGMRAPAFVRCGRRIAPDPCEDRSEERRVGKEWVRTFRYSGSPAHNKKKKTKK